MIPPTRRLAQPVSFFSERVEGDDLDNIPEIGDATSPDPSQGAGTASYAI